jgi:DNA-binding GntR family transcriptional regulator
LVTPGLKLGIESLREHYGTGATPMREALNRLAAEGWVQHMDQRGFVVTPVSEEALRELAKTRVWVETLALTQAMQASTQEWEEKVVLALHRLSKTPRSLRQENYLENPAWEKLHREFHLVVDQQLRFTLVDWDFVSSCTTKPIAIGNSP